MVLRVRRFFTNNTYFGLQVYVKHWINVRLDKVDHVHVVRRGGMIYVHNKPGVFPGNLGPANHVPLQTRLLNHGTNKVTLGPLKYAPTRRVLKRLAGGATSVELIHFGPDSRGVTRT